MIDQNDCMVKHVEGSSFRILMIPSQFLLGKLRKNHENFLHSRRNSNQYWNLRPSEYEKKKKINGDTQWVRHFSNCCIGIWRSTTGTAAEYEIAQSSFDRSSIHDTKGSLHQYTGTLQNGGKHNKYIYKHAPQRSSRLLIRQTSTRNHM